MKKRMLAVFLALVLCMGLTVPAFAAEAVSATAGVNLTKTERRIYETLENAVIEVAAGARTSTEVSVSLEPGEMSWTAQELGLSKIDNDSVGGPLNEKINESLDKVYTCLELNHPFEMFWANNRWNWEWWQNHTGDRVWLTELTYSLDVIPTYRGESNITADADKIVQAGTAVVERAKSIVQANAGKSDYEKLAAYRDEICALNVYNDAALEELNRDEYAYGDPWQLIYVFDGDPSTNALCEGYSKAFKYLCDLSEFSGDVTCYIAEGHEHGGAHMWNVVWIDGAFYPADITYIDTGAPASLFLTGASGSGREYTVSADGNRYTYIYREDQKDLFTGGYLPLSPTAYSPEQSARPQPGPKFTDTPSWCAKEAQWAVEQGITNGAGSADRFAPTQDCAHEQILTFLWRAAGKPTAAQAPVTVASYYQDGVNWAYEKGFIDSTFEPSAPCTRAQAVWYIWKALGEPPAFETVSFPDVDSGASYANAVSWALEKGVTTGDGGAFVPDRTCGRGEIACFLYRAYN